MEKRTIVAIILCIAVWLIWQAIFVDPEDFRKGQADGGAPDEMAATEGKKGEKEGAADDRGDTEEREAPPESRQDEKTANLETSLYKSTWSTRGANLKSFILSNYKERVEGKKAKDLEPEDLVSTEKEYQKPYTLTFRSEKTDFDWPEYTDWRLVEQKQDMIVFRYTPPGDKNIIITNTYRKNKHDFVIDLDVQVTNQGDDSISEQPILKMFAGYQKQQSSGCVGAPSVPRTPMCMANEELVDVEATPGTAASREPRVKWTGINEQYFLVAAVALGVQKSVCKMEARNDGTLSAELMYPETDIPPGGSATHKYRLFAGPKRLDLLEAVQTGTGDGEQPAQLKEAVDFGWLSFLCHPMLWLLKTFYSFVGNYGIAIVFLTIVIKLLLLPLTQKSMKSMKEMSKLKPLMDNLKEKYGDDKQRLNQEMMNLYKTHKINPMGGCFPMLLQMPIWIALYRMLYSSVELYQTSFIPGWIDDLSYRDPYFILPIVLGVAMFLQQKLSPTSADSQQAKIMMYAMPIFFTFIMLYLPAGLVLYIFVNSILSIGHQLIYNRTTNTVVAEGGSGHEAGS